jgi:hypothetical protein
VRGLEAVRRRLASDPAFEASLLTDPTAALSVYRLTGAEVLALARELDARRPAPEVSGPGTVWREIQ